MANQDRDRSYVVKVIAVRLSEADADKRLTAVLNDAKCAADDSPSGLPRLC